MDLTNLERLNLINQYLILEKLYPDEAEYYSKHRKALKGGYKLHYGYVFDNLCEELSEDKCSEILDILNMYRALTWSYLNITGKQEVDDDRIIFRGFDGNNETKQLSYTKYFIVELDRFPELLYGQKDSDFNSHMRSLDRYRRMLNVWQNIENEKRMNLSMDQIEEILAA